MPESDFDQSRRRIRETVLNMAAVALGRAVGLFEVTRGQPPEGVAITQESWALFEPYCQWMRLDSKRGADCDKDHRVRADPDTAPFSAGCSTCHAGIHNVRVSVTEGHTTLVLIGGQFRVSNDPILQLESERHFNQTLERYGITGEAAESLRQLWTKVPTVTHEDLAGKLEQVRAILRDYARINSELDKMRLMLERSQIDIAHEFATLAEPMRRNIDNLIEQVELTSRRDKAVLRPVLLHLADQIDTLTDSVAIHLPGYYNLRFTPHPDRLERLVRRCVKVYRSRAELRQIQLRVELDREDKKDFQVSAWHIEAALRNVIENAVKYSYRGAEQRPREVLVQGRVLSDGYELLVENYGVGIDEDELERIFEAGYQGRHKALESVTGSGMGLALVKQYIEWHGGRVWAKSHRLGDSKGVTPRTPYLTQIWIRLPFQPPKKQEEESR